MQQVSNARHAVQSKHTKASCITKQSQQIALQLNQTGAKLSKHCKVSKLSSAANNIVSKLNQMQTVKLHY